MTEILLLDHSNLEKKAVHLDSLWQILSQTIQTLQKTDHKSRKTMRRRASLFLRKKREKKRAFEPDILMILIESPRV